MKNCDGNNESTVEPVGYVNVRGAALHDCAEEHQSVGNPDHRNGDINWPLQFCVFFGAGKAQWKRNCCSNDDCGPAPECEGCEFVRNQACLTGALYNVVRCCKQCTTTKAEDNSVGMQRSQATEVSKW